MIAPGAKRDDAVVPERGQLPLAVRRKPNPSQPIALYQEDPMMPRNDVVVAVDEA